MYYKNIKCIIVVLFFVLSLKISLIFGMCYNRIIECSIAVL